MGMLVFIANVIFLLLDSWKLYEILAIIWWGRFSTHDPDFGYEIGEKTLLLQIHLVSQPTLARHHYSIWNVSRQKECVLHIFEYGK